MKRSLSLCVFLSALSAVQLGCSPEAANKMDTMGKDLPGKAKGAAGEMAKATGMDEMMGKATDALKSVEGGSDMLKSVTETFTKMTSKFSGITNADSATAALPDISKLTETFGGFTETFGKLPVAAKGAVSGVFASALEQLKPIMDKVLAIPGVESILKPAVDTLMSKLGAFKA